MKFTRQLAITLPFLLILASCGSNNEDASGSQTKPGDEAPEGSLVSTPLKPRTGPGPEGTPLFTTLDPAHTGVDFTNPLVDPNTHPLRRLYASSMVVGGITVGDVDGDSRPDLFFASGPASNGLYRQTGDFQFEDITEKAGLGGGDHWGVGTAMVDIDNDGDLDVYVCNHGTPNQLFLNDGQARFTESAKAFGLDLTEASHTPAFCDYDLDGHLDLFLLTNKYYHPQGKLPDNAPVAMMRDGQVVPKPEFEPYIRIKGTRQGPNGALLADWEDWGRPDRLYRNNGKGAFTDMTQAVGIDSSGWGLSATWWDYNDDGYPDLYVGNDFNSPDYLYRNNGDGTFTNVIEETVPHTPWFSMGADFGDLNQDGWFDFLIADMSGTNHYKQKTAMGAMSDSAEFLATAIPRQYMRNVLYLGTGRDRFMEGAFLAGFSATNWTWTVKICDFDNDGMDDVYFTNGMSKNYNESDNAVAVEVKVGETQWDRHVRAGTPELREQNIAYHNHGDLHFEDVSAKWGLADVGMSFGSVHTDLDRDGDLDLVVVNLDEPATVYRNDCQTGNAVLISLHGTASHPAGIGARVALESGGKVQRRQNITMHGYMASHEAILHFGLGEAETIDRLVIDWPSGQRQELSGLATNHHHTITEPAGKPPAKPYKRELPEPLFKRSTLVDAFLHQENDYDDFQDQPLLPNRQSQWGPGLALGDIDGDGQEDFILSSAALHQITFGKRRSDGSFEKQTPFQDRPPAKNTHYVEELGLLLFEADGDGDLDLYAVSGGYEWKLGTNFQVLLQDRLYKNDGQGNFTLDTQGLPPIHSSGGPIAAADFDQDGDLDLFVGGRVVPGKYPTAPTSYLLGNEDGRFRDITDLAAPTLRNAGMVTSALATDVDNDGRPDLLVAYDWGPVRYYHNDDGRAFSDQTESAGLGELTGWWNSLASADFDRDGDIDYVVGNFGYNIKYHASPEKPVLLYYGDFEKSGTPQLVEAEFEDDILYPVRGRSCSTAAMPHLANKFTTYHDWGLASLQDIYSEEKLEESLLMKANVLDSGILLNEGGRFTFAPLPHTAQIAPVFGVVAQEIDGDGFPDIYLVQNFYGPQVETGHMDGGLSLFLRGLGDGTFEPVDPAESGLVVSEDATGLAVTDLNGDGRPDFLIARNKGSMMAFENHTEAGQTVMVRLEGPASNPTAVGARVSLHLSDGSVQTAEMSAGSGYLTQSTAAVTFGLGQESTPSSIQVRWPDGSEKTYTSGLEGSVIVLKP